MKTKGIGLALLATFALLASAGCVPVEKLRKRAAFDISCPEEKLEVVDLGGTTRGVTGCEKKATYLWICGGGQPCNWVMNTDAGAAGEKESE
ncbi:MAG: hypothetical protein P1V51_08405 [Deltaproteobacteria bacterium]|nr:hypothetical protein [Deltaproteobacteria bacterium]